ncbi:Uncharacterised protein [Mycobacterium tuberculosis]|uniref:Uncharacterized protein n=1 Tax=Mycobacterium tuberculosis TaxID=1773 RepID=A0A0U0QTH2_MYCTX|nr:Uncharacterised protein [Mycobacterium tuberculosis]CNN21581.1 Uncharacterised protein [Mycobacterium tuberculosis]CNN47768.1 Uncharacterised protein [Mycobacterium tuberculosis]COV38029.1 Uncharacterised protein [Mycobacterium tuberculosis]COW07527.1 Uncharacterised protein [Mycobacterium tuberculosis]
MSPPGCRTLIKTFFRVSAAVTVRPRSASLAQATRLAMVGVSPVSWTTASGSPSMGRVSGRAVTTASTLAA